MELGFLAEEWTLGLIDIWDYLILLQSLKRQTRAMVHSRLNFKICDCGWLEFSCLEGPIQSLVLLFHAVHLTWATPRTKLCGVGKV
eukprot:CCRYP_020771-RA/>CCRYP_020771-RA protein AED:0.40 eAED:0.40 QI:0/0/0/1/0/0/2/0/85